MNRRGFFSAALAVSAPFVAAPLKGVASMGRSAREPRMIDFNKSDTLPYCFDILDAKTGENLNKLGISAADEGRGTLRFIRGYDWKRRRIEFAYVRRDIRIVPKPQYADIIARVEAFRRTPEGKRYRATQALKRFVRSA